MNRVTTQTPRATVVGLIRSDGYVLMENALNASQLEALNAAYDRQLSLHHAPSGALRIELPRILERDPDFEVLMDLPTTFPIARDLIGADIELATSGELDHKLPRTEAYIGWHNDFVRMPDTPYPRQNFWVRCTYFLNDVTESSGPFTLLPGSHVSEHGCPADLNDADGRPTPQPGQIGITGAAGSCLINNTEIWHCNSRLSGDLPRRLIMILYKHAWMKQWQDGYQSTPDFAARQTDPIRRQLTGAVVWHHDRASFPARDV